MTRQIMPPPLRLLFLLIVNAAASIEAAGETALAFIGQGATRASCCHRRSSSPSRPSASGSGVPAPTSTGRTNDHPSFPFSSRFAESNGAFELRSSSNDDGDGDGYGPRNPSRRSSSSSSRLDELNNLRDRATNYALIERVLYPGSSGGGASSLAGGPGEEAGRRRRMKLVELELTGRGRLTLPAVPKKGEEEGAEKMEQEEAVECLFLTQPRTSPAVVASSSSSPVPSLPVPLSPGRSKPQLRLLSFAHHSTPISKSLTLTLTPLLTNRDGSLWDNLPWTSWTIDPTRERNYDAASNPIEDKYHLGKRDAYNRMMGKDWFGRSLSGGNLRKRVEYWLDGEDYWTTGASGGAFGGEEPSSSSSERRTQQQRDDDDDQRQVDGDSSSSPRPAVMATDVSFDDDAARTLARRILELEVREALMEVAEAEERLAVQRSSSEGTGSNDKGDAGKEEADGVQSAEADLDGARSNLAEVEDALDELVNPKPIPADTTAPARARSLLTNLLEALTRRLDENSNPPPYRGAIGYDAQIDTAEEMLVRSVLPYRSPYDLLLEIISEQLNAEVIGTALENTSLFDGQLVLGGAVVLRRKGRTRTVSIDGENIEAVDEDDDYGSSGVKAGEVMVVECDADEAMGVALATGLGVWVDADVWDAARVDAEFVAVEEEMMEGDNLLGKDEGGRRRDQDGSTTTVVNSIPQMVAVGRLNDGGRSESNSEEIAQQRNVTPRPPRTTDAFLDFFSLASVGRPVFSTDNPIQSLEEYDELTIQDKARILMSLESFQGRLPRPRVLREAEEEAKKSARKNQRGRRKNQEEDDFPPPSSSMDPLDELLVPLIDESVRGQIQIRDAEARGDLDKARRLRDERSRRQIAKERAATARESGLDDDALALEEEADLYADLRADVTQDEGSYSRFLDKDEWYEKERVARVKRLDKKKFGTLLDGIE